MVLKRRIPSAWNQFCYSPILFATRRAYAAYTEPQPVDMKDASQFIRIVCIADTHSAHDRMPPLPPGDVLIHAGDLSQSGSTKEIKRALRWLSAAPHRHKIFIAGNHDDALANPERRDEILRGYPDLIYLEDSSTTLSINGRHLTVYGSPYALVRGNAMSTVRGVFSYVRGARDNWDNIPLFTDILITHAPPRHHLDVVGLGCERLLQRLWEVRPLLHVFGHVHNGRGVRQVDWSPVQRAYENVMHAQAGLADLSLVVSAAVRRKLWERQPSDRETMLVNAASMLGLQDEFFPGAITVDLALPSRYELWARHFVPRLNYLFESLFGKRIS
ncbi:Metallo-dependent phosphatase-like protein [Trametes elegans]|nr:Metallo-dependent phosphatase-like protein [Trametes elegans]